MSQKEAPRVLYISPQPFFEPRGTPLRVRAMVRALARGGAEVTLLSYALGKPEPIDGVRHVRAVHIPGIRGVAVGFSWRKVLLDIGITLSAWKLLLTRRFDVVHCVEESVFSVLPIARLRGVPVIFDLNSSVAHQMEYTGKIRSRRAIALARAIQRRALDSSALAITVGSALTETGVRSIGSGVPVAEIEDCADAAEAPVDAKLTDQLARELELDGKRVALYTGNMAPYQGVDVLIHAFVRVARTLPEAVLVIAGGSRAELVELEGIVRALGLSRQSRIAGLRTPAEVAALLELAHVVVSPRTGGTNTPLKIFSYMSSGVPIVATDLPTHRQVLDESCAILCAPDAESLGNAISRVLSSPGEYSPLGERARQLASTRYSRAEFERKVLGAYDAVLAGSF